MMIFIQSYFISLQMLTSFFAVYMSFSAYIPKSVFQWSYGVTPPMTAGMERMKWTVVRKRSSVLQIWALTLRWDGTPCNIYSVYRILKSDYNIGFKIFKICNFSPQKYIYAIPLKR